MAKTNLGRVSIVSKGTYNSETTYEKLDVVSYQGSSYIAKQSCKGIVPTNTERWDLLAEKGKDLTGDYVGLSESVGDIKAHLNLPHSGHGSVITGKAWEDTTVLSEIKMTANEKYNFIVEIANGIEGNCYARLYSSDGTQLVGPATINSGATKVEFHYTPSTDVEGAYVTIETAAANIDIYAEWSGTRTPNIEALEADVENIHDEITEKLIGGVCITKKNIELHNNITIDSVTGALKSGTRMATKALIPIEILEQFEVHSSANSGYRVFEYALDGSMLGYFPEDTWSWIKNKPVWTKAECQHDETAYIRILMYEVDDAVVVGMYNETKASAVALSNIANQPDLLNVAYSHVYLAPINTIDHFTIASHIGFNALKCDVRLTSDNQIVLCHDAGFSLDSDGKITSYDASTAQMIHNMTLADCKALTHATSYYDMGHESKPCDLNQFLSICKKNNVIPFITLRDEYVEETVEEIFKALKKYSLMDSAIINSMTFSSLEYVRSVNKDIILNYVLALNTPLTKKVVDDCYRLGACSVSLFTMPSDTTYTTWEESKPAIDYAKYMGVKLQNAQISNGVDYHTFVDYGIDGLQLTRAFLPYIPVQKGFRLNVSGATADIYGVFKWSTPYEADVAVSSSEIVVSNIKQKGSNAEIDDGIPALWMNVLPYNLSVKSESGSNVSIKWSDNAFHILPSEGESLKTNDTYIVDLVI